MKISVRIIRVSYIVEPMLLTYRDSYVRSCVLILSVSDASLMNED